MKYFIDLNLLKSNDCHYIPPKQGDKFKISGNVYYVHELNNEGNDAGFGWVWLYNPITRFYDYKMSVFDRRTIPGNTEIPHVGLSNSDAYFSVATSNIKQYGFELSFKRILDGLLFLLKNLFNL